MPIVTPTAGGAVPNVSTIASVNTFADVRLLGAGIFPVIEVLGGATVGDGQDGVFYWNSTSVTADDGLSVLAPSTGVTGRWIRLYSGFSLSSGASHVSTIQSGTGALTETVQAALRRMVHTDQYDTAGHFTTALNALSGTMGLSPYVKLGIAAGGSPASWGRSSLTFNGTTDNVTVLGLNAAIDGNSVPDVSVASLMLEFEQDYNDGSAHYAEIHLDVAAPGASYKRPFFAAMALSGANSGKITETFLLSDVLISLYGPQARLQAAAGTAAVGAEFQISCLDTSGKIWSLYSTGTGAGLGPGHFLIFNTTNSRYGLICTALGSVILGDLAALATNATDGFTYMPTCAGTPTGVPTSRTGKVAWVYDTTNNIIYLYNGAWKKTAALT